MAYKGKYLSRPKSESAPKSPKPQQPVRYDAPKPKATPKSKLPAGIRVLLTVLLVLVILFTGLMVFVSVRYLDLITRPDELFQQKPDYFNPDIPDFEKLFDKQQTDGSEIVDAETVYDDLSQEEQSTKNLVDEAIAAADDIELLDISSSVTNYLLIGTDRRGQSGYGNSDTMILVSLNKKTKKIHLTSLMRAIYVRIPRESGAVSGMLNWAYSYGGPELLIKTIRENFKIEVDHYISVDFSSFTAVVDAVDGIPMHLTSAEADFINLNTAEKGDIYEAGDQHLDGEAALTYARCRVDNDFLRTGRQRQVIEAIIRRVGELSLTQLDNLAVTILPALSTDMTNFEILAETINVPSYTKYNIDQIMIPIENQDGRHYTGIFYLNDMEMYSVDWETNLEKLEEFINS